MVFSEAFSPAMLSVPRWWNDPEIDSEEDSNDTWKQNKRNLELVHFCETDFDMDEVVLDDIEIEEDHDYADHVKGTDIDVDTDSDSEA